MRTFVGPLLALALAACATTPSRIALPALPNLAQPADGIATAGGISEADIEPLRTAGIRTVIDLRIDDETPEFDEGAVVAAAGIDYVNVPVHGADGLDRATVDAFDAALRDAKLPVLVHCASSNRVGAMAALRAAWKQGATPDEAIAIGRAWGLKGLEPEVRRVLGPPSP